LIFTLVERVKTRDHSYSYGIVVASARCLLFRSHLHRGVGTTNVTYGFSKNETLATSLVWAGVVFALSWPALIRSVDAKRSSTTLISLVALLLAACGAEKCSAPGLSIR
jgi:hypothetical protein